MMWWCCQCANYVGCCDVCVALEVEEEEDIEVNEEEEEREAW